MPGIVLFKRRWSTGSDDLVLPCLILSLLHFILLIIVIVYVTTSIDIVHYSEVDLSYLIGRNANTSFIDQVSCSQEIKRISFGYVALLVAASMLEVVICGFSMTGSILDTEKREPVSYVLYVRLVVGVTELVYTIVAVAHLSGSWRKCSSIMASYNIPAALVGINAIVFLVVVLVALIVFDSSGRLFYQVKEASSGLSVTSVNLEGMRSELDVYLKKSWKSWLGDWCCCVSNSQNLQTALEDASDLFYNFFRDLDLVPSDILAGLILLRHKQKLSECNKIICEYCNVDENLCSIPISEHTPFLTFNNATEVERYNEQMYYCNYAIASYGPLFYCMFNPGTGACKLTHECMCGPFGCCTGQRGTTTHREVQHDYCFGWRSNAVQRSLRDSEYIRNTDIVYISWANDIYQQPFFLSVDHDKKTVVVTIRGTLSEKDLLTDAVASPVLIPVDGNDGSWKGHKGIVSGASFIREQLIKDGILTRAFNFSNETRSYKLIILGHSLGAGIAAVLSIMLHPLYPQLICYCYAPPGGLLSYAAMQYSKAFIYTAVLGKDLVFRTGISQLEDLRNNIVDLLKETKLPKYKIILGISTLCANKQTTLLSTHECERTVTSETNAEQQESRFVKLYPPGQITHIVYRKHEQPGLIARCFRKKQNHQYLALQSDNENFNEIKVSKNMVAHHFPQNLLKAMEKVSFSKNCGHGYSLSATLPSNAPLPYKSYQTQAQHNKTGAALVDYNESRTTQHESSQQRLRAPLARYDSLSESGSGIESPPAHSANPGSTKVTCCNLNQNSSHKQTSSANYGTTSSSRSDFVHEFEDYVDTVLTQTTPGAEAVENLNARYSRSLSMPVQTQRKIDEDTLSRARFEPNLIPKPPRSHSFVQNHKVKH